MAGGWKHIDRNGEFLGTRLIDNMGDAYEALAECHWMIWELAGKISPELPGEAIRELGDIRSSEEEDSQEPLPD